jgi:DNA polymerase I
MLLLIDADITAYSSASRSEEEIQWDEDTWTIHSDLSKAKEHFDYLLNSYQEATGEKEFKLCFSGKDNFRKTLNPTYKSNRKGRKPVGYSALKDWAMETYPSMCKDTLEADDCMGILATKFKGQTIIVSMDKDLLTIPGKMYRTSPDGSGEWHDTDEKEADYRFLIQSMTGDATDGYAGIPGIGPKKAEEIMKKHGAVWKTVEDAYLKAGLTKEDALLNARMARILRQEDWDFETNQVKLWKPHN